MIDLCNQMQFFGKTASTAQWYVVEPFRQNRPMLEAIFHKIAGSPKFSTENFGEPILHLFVNHES